MYFKYLFSPESWLIECLSQWPAQFVSLPCVITSGLPVEPETPAVIVNTSSSGSIVEIILPRPYSTHSEHPVTYFMARYRQLSLMNVPGSWESVRSTEGASALPLPGLQPLTEYEIVLLAVNDVGRSTPSISTVFTTPHPGMFQ